MLFVLLHYQKLFRGFFNPLDRPHSKAPAGLRGQRGWALPLGSSLWVHILNIYWNGTGTCQAPISLEGRAGRSQASLTKC